MIDSVPGQLAELPLSELLQRLSAATPFPGGGTASAFACALAAGLVQMAAGFGAAPDATQAQRGALARAGLRAGELRTLVLELAELELSSYAPVLEVLRLPASDPDRSPRLRGALSEASAAPLRIAAAGAELTTLAAQTARACSRHLVGDAVTGALLAQAACQAASCLVALNLADDPADPRLRRSIELAQQAATARAEALSSDNSGRT